MYFGTSFFLIAVGAVLYFAVTATVAGIDIQTVGLILMIVGVLALLISFFISSRARARRPEPEVAERDRYVR